MRRTSQLHQLIRTRGAASLTTASLARCRILRRTTTPTTIARQMASEASKAKGKAASTEWQAPVSSAGESVRLRVFNSLTRSKVDFVPKNGNSVTWYSCGPTVYDASHMGHARNYVTQDILRRIMRDYFGYDVHFVMNITDIDDKIIVRARQVYLVDQLAEQQASGPSNALPDIFAAALTEHLERAFPNDLTRTADSVDLDASLQSIASKASDPTWLEAQRQRDEKIGLHIATAQRGMQAWQALTTNTPNARELVLANADLIGPYLDKRQGASVTDKSIFRALSSRWEAAFFKDMQALSVEPPTTLTRVSEFVEEIVDYVQQIIDRGFAYAAGGSVYFDTVGFDGAPCNCNDLADAKPKKMNGTHTEEQWNHSYAKLSPWSRGNAKLLADGEGSLTGSAGKRAASDFALWKASKAGEPAWDSPWGKGRPGWHIECSVMADHVFGQGMDIHSGGIDLTFPHHDNEIAQSEAYHGCRQWTNYFLHTGHLHIEGMKMSKSLKNFITIDEALSRYTARQMRIAFLMSTWNLGYDFKESAMTEAKAIEGTFTKFFTNVKALVAEASVGPSDTGRHSYNEPERRLMSSLSHAQARFRAALSDSFDTTTALKTLLDVLRDGNEYIAQGKRNINIDTLAACAIWITDMVSMLGLSNDKLVQIGWGTDSTSGANADDVAMPYVRVLSTFRDQIRQLARSSAPSQELLALCDRLRDDDLIDLGVALDDQEDGKALVKLVPAESLRADRDAKLKAASDKAAAKAANLAETERKRIEKLERGRIPPEQLYRSQTDLYSEFDSDGIPTQDAAGEPLSKGQLKKLKKGQETQRALHQDFTAWQASQTKA
ncbi:uncharacterized protein L969DRAFT_97424 [Mixia osmundae IAM 14324]|uniref:cysteine--tRNA ligase n=1 Tax=Mixia osmundae (strain CBS 9802 / IAM 14324 / JCM 22182 / KY 12970) TaxID=764103 RepID=G7DUJ2_MIXOS|nr:uncharacterized protein L969DRAFT_97424 [Mixia osmundae IAM 14324]KEI36413.1 hypothetical protein L969DRAFT_97424 [Mixia osmundae IAM 14324]GAA94252.1 hypothetical protein E5Q_00901 [Mixia osmundae IAM 14324]